MTPIQFIQEYTLDVYLSTNNIYLKEWAVSVNELSITSPTLAFMAIQWKVFIEYYSTNRKSIKKFTSDRVTQMINKAIGNIRPKVEKALNNSIEETLDKIKKEIEPYH